MPTPRQLEIFVAVASEGSVRQAADTLGISQPSVSKQLQAMERSLGGELFERRRGERVKLSPLGTLLLEDARQALQIQQRFAGLGARAATQAAPTVFLRSFLLEAVKAKLEDLHAAGMPRGTQFVLVDESEDIGARVRKMPGSFGLLRTTSLEASSGVTSLVLRSDECSLYASAEMARALDEGTLDQTAMPILVPGEGTEINLFTRRFVTNSGLDLANCKFGSQFIDVQMEKVLAGEGAAIFMDWHAKEHADAGRLVALAVGEPMHVLLVANPANDQVLVSRMANWLRRV